MKRLSVVFASLCLSGFAVAANADQVSQGQVPFMVDQSTGKAYYMKPGSNRLYHKVAVKSRPRFHVVKVRVIK